jgi:DNA-binding TFAR19-related protein (PDSD5 family)
LKISSVKANGRKREFLVETDTGARFPFPYSKSDPQPVSGNRLVEVFVDPELGNEAFTYFLESGAEGTVHIDHVLEYNEEPAYMADLLLHRLTVEAIECLQRTKLSRRHIAGQLNTSVPQLYRLLDPANYKKSMKQLVALLHLLDCEVDLVIKKKEAA